MNRIILIKTLSVVWEWHIMFVLSSSISNTTIIIYIDINVYFNIDTIVSQFNFAALLLDLYIAKNMFENHVIMRQITASLANVSLPLIWVMNKISQFGVTIAHVQIKVIILYQACEI